MENLGVRRPVVGSIAWLGLIGCAGQSEVLHHELTVWSDYRIELRIQIRLSFDLFGICCEPGVHAKRQ